MSSGNIAVSSACLATVVESVVGKSYLFIDIGQVLGHNPKEYRTELD